MTPLAIVALALGAMRVIVLLVDRYDRRQQPADDGADRLSLPIDLPDSNLFHDGETSRG